MELSRKDAILKLIVEHFVKTGEPVSSQVLIDNYPLDYSSATIRNEMMSLESDGLIEKPYYSSGRIPSAVGYRYYVDNLRQRRMDGEIRQSLQRVFDNRQKNIEDVIEEGCKLLSQMTNMTVVMLGGDSRFERVAKIQIIPTSKKSAVCIFVCESGQVINKNFLVPDNVSLDDLDECVKIFNERLAGSRIEEIEIKMQAIRPIISEYVEGFELLFKTLVSALLNVNDRFSVFGASNLLEQKEFTRDLATAKKIMEMLESSSIWSCLKSNKDTKMIDVSIGETFDDDVAIVSTELPTSKSIAVIGSTRMDYDKVIEAFEFFNEEIKKLLK